jgi:hypothetical protein
MKRLGFLSSCSKGTSAIVLIALVAIGIRLIPLARGANFAILPGGDSKQYLELAEGLRNGCGFARLINRVCATPEVFRTPGYPLLIAMQPGIPSLLVTQSLMAGALCWVLALCVRRRWNLRAALLAETVVALDMPSLTAANLVMSDAFFQLVVFLAVMPPLFAATEHDHCWRSWVKVSWAAIGGACAILVRPIALLLPTAMAMPFLISTHFPRRRRLGFAAVIFFVPTATTFAWVSRNYLATGYCGLSTVSAVNLYFYRAAEVVARDSGTSVEQAQQTLGARLGVTLSQVSQAGNGSALIAKRMTQMGRRIVFLHPREVFFMTLASAFYMAIIPDRTLLAWEFGLRGGHAKPQLGLAAQPFSLGRIKAEVRNTLQSPLLMFLLIGQFVLTGFTWLGVALALYGSMHSRFDYRMWTLYLTMIAIMLIVLAAGAEAAVRFRVPAVPLLAVVMGLGYFPAAEQAFEKDASIQQLSRKRANEIDWNPVQLSFLGTPLLLPSARPRSRLLLNLDSWRFSRLSSSQMCGLRDLMVLS